MSQANRDYAMSVLCQMIMENQAAAEEHTARPHPVRIISSRANVAPRITPPVSSVVAANADAMRRARANQRLGRPTAEDLRLLYPKAAAEIERGARAKASARTPATHAAPKPKAPRAGMAGSRPKVRTAPPAPAEPKTYAAAVDLLNREGVPRAKVHAEIMRRWQALGVEYGQRLHEARQRLYEAEARHRNESTPESARAMGLARVAALAVARGEPLE